MPSQTELLAAAAPFAGINAAAIIPIAVLALGFLVYCLVDLYRGEVQHLPKWAWALICCLSVPVGGIIYLLVGRAPR